MVRKGSPVRVRQRAYYENPAKAGFSCLRDRAAVSDIELFGAVWGAWPSKKRCQRAHADGGRTTRGSDTRTTIHAKAWMAAADPAGTPCPPTPRRTHARSR